MSFITEFLIKPQKHAPVRSPAGSFTVNSKGQIMTSTLAQSFPSADLHAIAKAVLRAFGSSEASGIAVRELSIYYLALKIVARRMRGGAILFLEAHSRLEHEKQCLQTKAAFVPEAEPALLPS